MSTVAIWDLDMRLVAIEEGCPEPGATSTDFEAVVKGNGPVRAAIRTALQKGNPLLGDISYVTVDRAAPLGGQRRLMGKVAQVAIEERQCECGTGHIITTTIRGLR